MRKYCLILLGILLVISCEKRDVLLAETDSVKVTTVTDVSPIYIFLDEKTGQAEFNRNNMIGTTNWLVNIDKRLSLEEILPHLIYLQNKRSTDGMHKNDSARNYFSCSNPGIQNLSFIDFSEVIYHEQPIADFLKTRSKNYSDQIPVYLNIESTDKIIIGKNFTMLNSSKSDLLEDLTSSASKDSLANIVFINFKSEMSFQNYIDFKSILLKLEDENIVISEHEFIYN